MSSAKWFGYMGGYDCGWHQSARLLFGGYICSGDICTRNKLADLCRGGKGERLRQPIFLRADGTCRRFLIWKGPFRSPPSIHINIYYQANPTDDFRRPPRFSSKGLSSFTPAQGQRLPTLSADPVLTTLPPPKLDGGFFYGKGRFCPVVRVDNQERSAVKCNAREICY